ncbi:hypothetical protein MNBD_GAMMA24-2682 [hydrothermal vent metagenome]|uniref:Response regulatory domain-containing protein n=1 Tax=hydrothermal vent metagenome TaxID=652676 RepID=A0A3B1BRU5_9ZZZZ
MVSPLTLQQWARNGWISAHNTSDGQYRFLYHDLEYFAHERGLTLTHDDDNRTRILIVDDDFQLSGYLRELLSGLNHNIEVETANDGFDANGKIQTGQPHILLLDLMMPGLNGFDVCHQLKSNPATQATRIITMTGYHTPENVERILNVGAEACMAKPLDTDTLLILLGLGEETKATEARPSK